MPDSTTRRTRAPRTLKAFVCNWCGTDFQSRAQAPLYCSSSCRERSRYQRDHEKRLTRVQQYRRDNKDKIRAAIAERRKNDPARFSRQRRESYLRHREKRIAEANAYQRANPQVSARSRHKRRGAQGFAISERDLQRSLQRNHGCCAYCGVKLLPWGREHDNSLQWDHVVPIARGGRDSIGNLAPACRFCNCSKNRKTIIEWRVTRTDDRWKN